MATVIVTPTAERNLDTLIRTHFLPDSTQARFRQSLQQLRQFPESGSILQGRRPGLRFILGPWRWMIVVYRYYEDADQVRIVSVQDARSARSQTTSRHAVHEGGG
jgi:plasmid stabilization system protein ParE